MLLLISGCTSSGDRPPLLRGDGEFVYPAAAKSQHVEGYVVVEYDISTEGRVLAPHIVEAEPAGVFEGAALEYVTARVYAPARRSGGPVFTRGQRARIEFKLGETND